MTAKWNTDTRSIALQHVGPCRTEASQKPVPLDPELAEVLLTWRRRSPYPMDDDWVFASPASRRELPYWSFSILRVYIRPALKAAKIPGKVGWDTFRHSYATILKSHGEDMKTVQELLRHANSSVTMNLYAQAVTDMDTWECRIGFKHLQGLFSKPRIIRHRSYDEAHYKSQ
jgi:integrase